MRTFLIMLAGAGLMAAGPAPMPGMQGGSPADQAMSAGMSRMNQDMQSAPMTGDPDRDFVAMMVPHHQGAVDMAQAELKYGKDPALRKLAAGIVAAQRREIAQMQGWQAKHPAP